MKKLVLILVLSFTLMAIAQEDYQETDYSTASSDAEVDRGIASRGLRNCGSDF